VGYKLLRWVRFWAFSGPVWGPDWGPKDRAKHKIRILISSGVMGPSPCHKALALCRVPLNYVSGYQTQLGPQFPLCDGFRVRRASHWIGFIEPDPMRCSTPTEPITHQSLGSNICFTHTSVIQLYPTYCQTLHDRYCTSDTIDP
jgi:hypothetical protein